MHAAALPSSAHPGKPDVFRLPALREELNLHPGPALASGEPSWTLEDPVRNGFFRIDWMSFEILRRWELAAPDAIARSVDEETALNATLDDVAAVLAFLQENQLLRPDPLASSRALAERHKAAGGTLATRLLHGYLFFRIPLVKPDAWLNRVAPSFNWLFSSGFLRLTMLALLVGGVLVWRQWDVFRSTLADSFTPSGILAYALALTFVKCAHELGHALTAKRHGCHVPTMGLAFLVLWPVPYTDTNDVWRLPDKRKRLGVAAAGVRTELLIAVWATLAWTLLPDGLLRSMAFPLATTTWIATLAINASPFMRFDGYFVLSDWLDMPNLHARAFALARWDLRERLFGLGEPPPEYFPRRRHWGLIAFAWSVWIYRLVLFLGIAVLVYHFFIKLLGILLFCIEMSWFVIRPIANEIKVWRSLAPRLKESGRARTSFIVLIALVLLALVPWPTRVQSGALLRPTQVFPVHAPEHAQVTSLPFKEGARVAQGQQLIGFAAPESKSRREALDAQAERLRWQIGASSFDAEQRAGSAVLREQLATLEAQLALLTEEEARYAPRAPFAGVLRDVEPELAPGVWVGRNERVAVLVGEGVHEASSYLDEETVRRVAVGDSAHFYPEGMSGPVLKVKVANIDRDATRVLPGGPWAAQWATAQGGPVQARERNGAWYPEHAVYRVSFTVEEPAGALAGRAWRGKVVIDGEWEAPGARFVRSLAALLRREAGF